MRLKELGNTLIVVEHDEDTIKAADWVVDIGPGAGEHGGQVVHSGTVEGLYDHPDSITGQYLSGRREIPVPAVRRPRTPGRELVVKGAREHNLRDLDVAFPLGLFVAVTGVSGSGKSTLVNDILYTSLAKQIYRSRNVPGRHRAITGVEQVDKVIHVDQSPIGRTPRSNPATYTGVFDHIRKLFASTPEAKMRGYLQGRFSFNVKGGRCEACAGDGTIKIEMNFLPDVYVPCEVCHGARYNRETLEVHYKGKTIAEVLDMPIEEAVDFFSAVPPIARHMKTLVEVGLGYVRLGQPATTLSGGEAQRVKLSSELQKRSTGGTVYVLDEPTTGLHFEDIRKLLLVLGRLVDQGNTVLVIEHNLDVIKTADWIIDMGPEGGSRGGMLVSEGTPEAVAADPSSFTGHFLKPLLEGREAKQPPKRAARKPRPSRRQGTGQEDSQEARRRRRRPAGPLRCRARLTSGNPEVSIIDQSLAGARGVETCASAPCRLRGPVAAALLSPCRPPPRRPRRPEPATSRRSTCWLPEEALDVDYCGDTFTYAGADQRQHRRRPASTSTWGRCRRASRSSAPSCTCSSWPASPAAAPARVVRPVPARRGLARLDAGGRRAGVSRVLTLEVSQGWRTWTLQPGEVQPGWPRATAPWSCTRPATRTAASRWASPPRPGPSTSRTSRSRTPSRCTSRRPVTTTTPAPRSGRCGRSSAGRPRGVGRLHRGRQRDLWRLQRPLGQDRRDDLR